MFTKTNIKSSIRCVLLHNETEFVNSAVELIANQWKNSKIEMERNLKSILEDSRDGLPCHLGLAVKHDQSEVLVGHVKLTKADGRSDGACCIFYSLVVDPKYRRLGLGRILTEEGENYARSLNMAFAYLSTPDMASFYEHLGYKLCEPVSSLRSNSSRLNAAQVSSIESIFAKRLNITASTAGNTWLRKRLISEYEIVNGKSVEELFDVIIDHLSDVCPSEYVGFLGFVKKVKWQQQTGPSCGVSAVNMLKYSLHQIDNSSFESIWSICEYCTPNTGYIEHKPSSNCLEKAIALGISNDGELFCAYNVAYLAWEHYQIEFEICDISKLNENSLLYSLSHGFPVMIPYDRRLSDHLPGLFEGRHAHWALLIGILNRYPKNEFAVVVGKGFDTRQIDNITLSLTESQSISRFVSSECYVVCSHGMSSKPFVCLLSELVQSNQQLVSSKSKFYLASADLKHLRDKVLFCKNGLSKY